METKDDVNLGVKDNQIQIGKNRSYKPQIAGFILIIAGILSILFWISLFSLDVTTFEKVVDISQINQIYQKITPEQILGFLHTCAIIGCIIAVFPILGGILAIKRKLWGISIASSFIGLFSLGMLYSSSLLSFIAMILLFISRKEFQRNI